MPGPKEIKGKIETLKQNTCCFTFTYQGLVNYFNEILPPKASSAPDLFFFFMRQTVLEGTCCSIEGYSSGFGAIILIKMPIQNILLLVMLLLNR